MPIFQIDSLIEGLQKIGVQCKRGTFDADVEENIRPYFERWLCNRDGFIKVDDCFVDYIGVEEVMRMGPFFDIYCLIQNTNIVSSDQNAQSLVSCYPRFFVRTGKIVMLGWTGGLLSHYLTNDDVLSDIISRILPGEEFAKLFVRAADFGCIIQTQVWEPSGLLLIYPLISRIGLNIRNLLKIIHLGETDGI